MRESYEAHRSVHATSRWTIARARRSLVGLAIAVAGITACGGDSPTGPGDSSSPVGSFAISTVNAKALPFTMFSDTNYKYELTAGSMALTSDGKFVLFLTDVAPTGGTLHVVGMDGGEVLSFPGVLDVLAAHGSGIVFTDHASDPDVYPNVADLEYIDVASMSEPVLVEGAVLDAKNFQLDARGERVIYLRSGVDRDTDDPEHDGVFACDLP